MGILYFRLQCNDVTSDTAAPLLVDMVLVYYTIMTLLHSGHAGPFHLDLEDVDGDAGKFWELEHRAG